MEELVERVTYIADELALRPYSGITSGELDSLRQAAARITSDTARIERRDEALRAAEDALRNYACHGGPDVPCRRTADQCSYECGKPAGDALVKVLAALQETINGQG